MNARAAVLDAMRRHRADNPDGLTPEAIAYALRWIAPVSVSDVERHLAALEADGAVFCNGGAWVAGGQPDTVSRSAPRVRRNGTKPHRIVRSSVPMRGSVLILIPKYLDD